MTTVYDLHAAEDKVYPLSGIRRVIAQKMTLSLREAAQLSFHGEADITELQQWRRNLKLQGKGVSLEDAIIAAYAQALSLYPVLNATIDADVVTEHHSVRLAVAIAGPTGLVTPVIADADRLDLNGIAAVRSDLVARAASGQIKVSEMKGATATLSNLGQSRVRYFTPILNYPQTAILGVGTICKGLKFDGGGAIVAKETIGLSLTVDHRLIDGAPAAQFLDFICDRLENFARESY